MVEDRFFVIRDFKNARFGCQSSRLITKFFDGAPTFIPLFYVSGQKKTLDRNFPAPGVLDRCFLCAYVIGQFAYTRLGSDWPY
jgi:hypothetical protein